MTMTIEARCEACNEPAQLSLIHDHSTWCIGCIEAVARMANYEEAK